MKYLAPDFASTRDARAAIAAATDQQLLPALMAVSFLLGIEATRADLLAMIDQKITREETK